MAKETSGTELAKAWVQILPSTRGMKGELTKALDGEANEAGTKSGHAIAGAIGKIIGGVAVTGAIKKIGSSIVDLAKQSVAATGEFEQLAGGMEKIFSGMDTRTILSDANEAFKTLGLSANDYLETINDVGASFSATMGAEKAYETAKRGLTAISDYASGTGKSVDILKEKFSMITRATSSYQSIADQFSGILPGTTTDFLAQAQAAGILSKSYTKLSEVPIDEYQQAVAEMLVKGVEAQNLTGNTLEEATSTLTGSLGMLSAAWQNTLTAIGGGNQTAVENAMNGLTESLSAVVDNILPVIENILPQIPTLLEKVAPELIAKLPELEAELLPAIIDMVVEMGLATAENAPDIIQGLLDGLIIALPELIPGAVSIVTTLAEALTEPETLMLLIASAIDIVVALLDGLAEADEALIGAAPEIIENILIGIIESLPVILAGGGEIIAALVDGIVKSFGALVDAGADIIDEVQNGLKGKIDEAREWGKDLIFNFLDGIKSKIVNVKETIGNIAQTIKNIIGFSEPEEGPLSNFHTFAPDMMTLFIDGIDGEEQRLTAKINDVFDFRDAVSLPDADILTYSDAIYSENITNETDSDRIVNEIESLKSVIKSLKIVLNNDALVGGLSDGMDAVLGEKTTLAERGL